MMSKPIVSSDNKGVSVCLATHNGEKYLRQQIDSILVQLSDDDELVISDDSSEDSTRGIIEEYHDSRVRFCGSNYYGSPVLNFEASLRQARKDQIFLADQDDVWMPRKREVMVAALAGHDMVLSDCVVTDEDLRPRVRSYFEASRSRPGFWKNLVRNSFLGCCMAFNRRILDLALPFPKDVPMHDWWIGLIGEFFGKTVLINTPLLFYRRHKGVASTTSEKSFVPFFRRLLWRSVMLKNIGNRWLNLFHRH